MSQHPCHKENIVALKRIEGQVRGVQKMIEDGRYCVDILDQLRAIIRSVASVKKKIYRRHLEDCVKDTMEKGSLKAKQEKIEEILNLFNKHMGG